MAVKDKKYLDWIRKQPCVVTGMDFTQTDIVAHHIRMGGNAGVGQKPSDYRTIPLTALEHARLHQGVEREYYESRNLEVDTILMDLALRWERSQRKYFDWS